MKPDINAQSLKQESVLTDLIKRHNPKMSMMLGSVVGVDNVEDVLQEVWLTVINKIDQFQGKSSFSTWLYRIAYNHAYQWCRKNNRQPTVSIQSDDEIDYFKADNHWQNGLPHHWHTHTPEQLYQLEHFAAKLQIFLTQLPAKQASMLIMHDAEQINFAEICNILSISASNGRVLLHRARQALYWYYDAFITDSL